MLVLWVGQCGFDVKETVVPSPHRCVSDDVISQETEERTEDGERETVKKASVNWNSKKMVKNTHKS